MRRALVTTVIAGAAATALTVTGCTGSVQPGGSTGGKPVDGKTFTMALGADPGNLDPLMNVKTVTFGVDRFLYATLINLTADGKPVPGLAKKWQADSKKASFTLRPGITCSDGSPLTATDVANNINFVGNTKNNSPLAGVLVQPGTKATADNAARTVTVASGAPDAFLLRNIGGLFIACGKGLKDRSLLAKGQAGTGMFTMAQVAPGDHYTLTRRKDFTWGPDSGKTAQTGLPDSVVIKVIPNETTATNLLKSGQLNAATINGPDQQRLQAQGYFHSDLEAPYGELFYNQTSGRPSEDQAVRKALTQALDLTQLGKVLTNGKGKPSQGLVTENPKACTGDNVTGNLPAHDLAAAKSALDAAGWKVGPEGVRTKGGKRLSLTVLYGTYLGPTTTAGAEFMQQAWKSIGADVTLKGLDSPGVNQALTSTGAWDVWLGAFTTSLPSPLVPFLSGPVPPQGQNYAHIQNKQYEELVKKATTKSGAASCPDWNAAEVALIKAADLIPYVNTVSPTFGKNAKFTVQSTIDPYSIRMYG
jgi:peptide/nickel transport system substrate-binding protein